MEVQERAIKPGQPYSNNKMEREVVIFECITLEMCGYQRLPSDTLEHTFPVFYISVPDSTPVTVDGISILANSSMVPPQIDDPLSHRFYINEISSCNTCQNP